MQSSAYRGRFAPSPTGPLHFGSLIAALGSFLDARSQGGSWLVRVEDIDPPREQAGAVAEILRALEAFGLRWDERVYYQSRRSDAYCAIVRELQGRALVYPCACTRREVGGGPYPGTCRSGMARGRRARSLRIRTGEQPVRFTDRIRGARSESLASSCGDFIVRRSDGWFAYHLAVTVDDAWQGVTDIVRGGDLLGATAAQVYLQGVLDAPTPRYAHLPVALGRNGSKLSKQNRAPALDLRRPGPILVDALRFLGQDPPVDFAGHDVDEVLAWAIANWRLEKVPRAGGLKTPEYA